MNDHPYYIMIPKSLPIIVQAKDGLSLESVLSRETFIEYHLHQGVRLRSAEDCKDVKIAAYGFASGQNSLPALTRAAAQTITRKVDVASTDRSSHIRRPPYHLYGAIGLPTVSAYETRMFLNTVG